jgi:hypothetical protein
MLLPAMASRVQAQPTTEPTEEVSVDRDNPYQMANLILDALRNQDWATLQSACTPVNVELFSSLVADPSGAERLMSGWRWEAVLAAPEQLSELRWSPHGREHRAIWAFLHEMSDTEVAVLVLESHDDGWVFEDINSPPKAAWEAALEVEGN